VFQLFLVKFDIKLNYIASRFLQFFPRIWRTAVFDDWRRSTTGIGDNMQMPSEFPSIVSTAALYTQRSAAVAEFSVFL